MITEQQLAFRQLGVSGTDATAILGVCPYRTIADVWLSKKHPQKMQPPSKAVASRLYWGELYEPLIAEEFARQTGANLYKPEPKTFRSATDAFSFVLGSPDFLYTDKKRGLEIKKVSPWQKDEWGPAGTDKVPTHVLIQSHHYMLLTGYPEWDVACLIGDSDFRHYRLYGEREFLCQLINAEKDFYEKYIKGDAEPDFSTAEALGTFLLAKYPKHSAREIDVSPYDKELRQSIMELRDARAAKKAATDAAEAKKVAVMQHMGDAALLEWEEEAIKITWKTPAPKDKVDWDKVAQIALEKANYEPEERAKLIAAHTEKRQNKRTFRVYDKNSKDEEEA